MPTLGRPRMAIRGSSSIGDSVQIGDLQAGQPVEQIARAEAVAGGDGHRLAEPELVELRGDVEVARVVDLVGDDDHRLRGGPEQRRDLGVAGTQAGARVDHMEDRVGIGDRLAGLMLNRTGERILGGHVDAARVDQRDRDAVPLRLDVLAVTRDPGLRVGHRLPAAGEPVDERALAGVGVADDRDLHSRPRDDASAAIRSTTSVTPSPVVSTSTASVGDLEGAVLPPAVAGVTVALGGEDSARVLAALRRAPARPLVLVGAQMHLQRRVGADDRADVPALGDPAAGRRRSSAGARPSPRGRRDEPRRARLRRRPRAP